MFYLFETSPCCFFLFVLYNKSALLFWVRFVYMYMYIHCMAYYIYRRLSW